MMFRNKSTIFEMWSSVGLQRPLEGFLCTQKWRIPRASEHIGPPHCCPETYLNNIYPCLKRIFYASKQNRNFRPKGEGRSGHRPLLPKRRLNILVDLTLGKSYHSVVTFLHAQKIKCYTFSIQTSSKLISYYVCPWKVGP